MIGNNTARVVRFTLAILACIGSTAFAAVDRGVPRQDRYMAHPAVEDQYGVIAPWYDGLNGQCDFRVRIAAETLKRYPWKLDPKQGRPAPDYIYNGRWNIDKDGTIRPQPLGLWGNGDLAQRGAFALLGWVQYYRYTGDAAAIAHMSMIADVLLTNAQTAPDHPWPRFLISVPCAGEPYGQADPRGFIQLDLVALTGTALLQAYQITGDKSMLEPVQHWADLLAEKRDRNPEGSPWNRYANPEDVFWEDQQTGGVVMLLRLFDDLIHLGYTGKDEAIAAARQAGVKYLQNKLLGDWLVTDAWARTYWDWNHDVQSEDVSEMAARYLMRHPEWFPGWQADARNIPMLFVQRACVDEGSRGDVYSGAWAFPEGPQCCGRSLQYPPMQIGAALAEYGVRTGSEWATELARRMLILATYDAHETGVVEDGFDGGDVVASTWLQCAHPFPFDYVMDAIGWLPEVLGANRENHIVRSSSIVSRVYYNKGRISYTTFDAPAGVTDVLRLAFRPTTVTADNEPLAERPALDAAGFTVKPLSNGDCIVSIRHDNATHVVVTGDDPQTERGADGFATSGQWHTDMAGVEDRSISGIHTGETGAAATCEFEGNQVRLIGSVGPHGGQADVFLDGTKQLCGIDCWNPDRLHGQVLWYRNGLKPGKHTLKIVVRDKPNPRALANWVWLSGLQFSAADGDAGFGAGGGPVERQAWICGYPERQDYIDSKDKRWRTATEMVLRVGQYTDPVMSNWYTQPRRLAVAGTSDPKIYRHGIHAKDVSAYVTAGPGSYHVRLSFMEHRLVEPDQRAMDICINGKPVVRNLDIAATAMGKPASVQLVTPSGKRIYDGLFRAVDLVFNDIEPSHGVIAIRFVGCNNAEAIVSAIEVAPGRGGEAHKPIAATAPATEPERRK